MNEMQLEPHMRLRRIRASKRCAGCHKSCANLLPCGVRLEETLSDILNIRIPKGELKLCGECKAKLTSTHELFKCLALVKNTETHDGTAVRFLNSKTLKTHWFCQQCNKSCMKLPEHRKTCPAPNARTSAQENGVDTNNRIIIGNGKRTARDDRQAKRVKFDLNNKENNEIPRQNNVSCENVRRNSTIVGNELNFNDEYQEHFGDNGENHQNSVGSVMLRRNSVSGEMLRRNSVSGEMLRRNSVSSEMLRRNSVSGETQHINIVNGGRQCQDGEPLRGNSVSAERQRKNSVYRDIENNVAKDEPIPTQVEITSVVIISDDEEDVSRQKTHKKQSHLEQYFQPGPSRLRGSSRKTPAGTEALQPLTSHLEAQKFICDMCGENFNSNKSLTVHKATRGSECRTCKIVFCTGKQLVAHKRVAHPRLSRANRNTEEPTECKCCKKVFATRKEFATHYTRMGGRCHGAAEGLMDSQCECQLGSPPVTPRHGRICHGAPEGLMDSQCDGQLALPIVTPRRRDSVNRTSCDLSVTALVHAEPREVSTPSEATPLCEVTSPRKATPLHEVLPQREEATPPCDVTPLREVTPAREATPPHEATPPCDVTPLRQVTPARETTPPETTPPPRQNFTPIKVDPDMDLDIYDHETEVLMMPAEMVKASNTPNSEVIEEMSEGNQEALETGSYLGRVEVEPGTSVDHIRSESEYPRNTSCDSSQLPGPAVKAKSIFSRRQLHNEDSMEARGADVIRGLLYEHRRVNVDHTAAGGGEDFTPATAMLLKEREEFVNMFQTMRRMLNRVFGDDIGD